MSVIFRELFNRQLARSNIGVVVVMGEDKQYT
jgi:hypothetical protein